MTVAFECFVDNMKLSYNPETNEYKNAEGVEIRPMKFGSTEGTENLHPIVPVGFKAFIEYFVWFQGYERDQNIAAAPYDFRLSPRSK